MQWCIFPFSFFVPPLSLSLFVPIFLSYSFHLLHILPLCLSLSLCLLISFSLSLSLFRLKSSHIFCNKASLNFYCIMIKNHKLGWNEQKRKIFSDSLSLWLSLFLFASLCLSVSLFVSLCLSLSFLSSLFSVFPFLSVTTFYILLLNFYSLFGQSAFFDFTIVEISASFISVLFFLYFIFWK